MQVTHHLLDHAQLLEIFFAENGFLRGCLHKQLIHNGRHPFKEMRAGDAFKALCRPARRDRGGMAVPIHSLRHKDRVTFASCRQLVEVGLNSARIAVEILMRGKLQGVNIDRGDDALAMPGRDIQQGQMPVMQIAHGRDQTDRLAVRRPACAYRQHLFTACADLHDRPLICLFLCGAPKACRQASAQIHQRRYLPRSG